MSDFRPQVFLARIKIPSDVPRDDYVVYALRTRTACVEVDDGADFIKDCPIVYSFCGFNDGFIHSLDFPPDTSDDDSDDTTQKQLGSQVVMLSVTGYEKPLIIGCLGQFQSPLGLEEEKQLKLYRTSDTGSFLIEGSGLAGLLKLIVTSTTPEGGKIDVSTLNEYKTGEITFDTDHLYLTGRESLNLSTEKLFQLLIRNVDTANGGKAEFTTIKYEFGVGFSLIDEFENEYVTIDGKTTIKARDTLEVESEEILLGTGATEFVAKGDTLQGLLEEVLDAINQITVTTALGPSGTPINFAVFLDIRTRLNTMLSSKSKVE